MITKRIEGEQPKPPDRIVLEMSEEEASRLKWVMGWSLGERYRGRLIRHEGERQLYESIANKLWESLDGAGVEGWGVSHDVS